MAMMMRGPVVPPKPISRASLQRVARLFIPYRAQLAWTAIAVLVSSGLGVLAPLFLRTIVNQGLLAHNLGVVTRFCLFALGATLASNLCSLAYGYLSTLVGQRIMRDLRNQLYRHLQGMSLRFFTGTRTGEIQSRLVSDVGGVDAVVSATAANILANVTTVLSVLVAMLYMDWRLTLLSVGMGPVFAVVAARVGALARKIRGEVQGALANMNSTMQETLSVSGALLTKTSGRSAQAVVHFEEQNETLARTQTHMAVVMRLFFSLMGITFAITPVLVYWLAGYLIIGRGDPNLTLGSIVAFVSLQAAVFFPLMSLLSVQVELTSSLALFDRIFEFLDLKQEITDAPDAVAISPAAVKGRVAFTDVTFRYEDLQETPALSGITFEAAPGSLVALVGHSGAGKTTLTYLIPRLYDANEGRVEIDGHDVRQIRLDSLSGLVGVVTQETYLVHDTIRENLRYGKPDASDEELIAATKAAAIHDHIASLPEGYDTVVGERGYKLSGGEKQRIAIARAILKNPRILILDEATSALDTHSERLIQHALAGLMVGRTTFAIAHRLSTILKADQILVLAGGEIVERGSHEELIARGGAYAELYAAQFQERH
jgi:ATP-binding cassette, subfamily B, bacterial